MNSVPAPLTTFTAVTGPVQHRRILTPLGTYVIAAGPEALIGVWREGQLHFPAQARLGESASAGHDLLDEAEQQLLSYLADEREDFDLPLAPAGTAFQQAVWEQLLGIERGTTVTYGHIAQKIGKPRGAQAVGRAVGSNPISIVVPCHRVLGSSGALTGYAGGVDTKLSLLQLEGALLT